MIRFARPLAVSLFVFLRSICRPRLFLTGKQSDLPSSTMSRFYEGTRRASSAVFRPRCASTDLP